MRSILVFAAILPVIATVGIYILASTSIAASREAKPASFSERFAAAVPSTARY